MERFSLGNAFQSAHCPPAQRHTKTERLPLTPRVTRTHTHSIKHKSATACRLLQAACFLFFCASMALRQVLRERPMLAPDAGWGVARSRSIKREHMSWLLLHRTQSSRPFPVEKGWSAFWGERISQRKERWRLFLRDLSCFRALNAGICCSLLLSFSSSSLTVW